MLSTIVMRMEFLRSTGPGGSTHPPVGIQGGTLLSVPRNSNLLHTAYLAQFSTLAVDNLYTSGCKSNKIEGPRRDA